MALCPCVHSNNRSQNLSRKENIDMSKLHTKSVLTALTLAVILGLVPTAFSQTLTVIAGSSALFNTVALGAYNAGAGPADAKAPTSHWSTTNSHSYLALEDTRPTTANIDVAQGVWVVWDSNSTTSSGIPDVWVFVKVDSVVGDRCFFAQPACKVIDQSGTEAGWTAAANNAVSAALWGADTANLPSTAGEDVLAAVESRPAVNVAATDIRPEDAWFADNRVNSALGGSVAGGTNTDGLDGLGYNANNAAGQAPNYVTSTTGSCTGLTDAKAVGTPIYSSFQNTGTTSDAANVLAFNILGKDPISCTAIPTYTVGSVGAAPIVFVFSRGQNLAGLANATDQQLQQVFSGTTVNASAFNLSPGTINAFLREPLSGTYNTAEASVFRYPTLYSSNAALAQNVAGTSQETGVGSPSTLANNPLNHGNRYRAIGTSEEVESVACSFFNTYTGGNCPTGLASGNSNSSTADGIGYAFYSYGNVAKLADSTNYGYITLDGVDPIWTSYQPLVGSPDPGQPVPANYGGALGVLPESTENGLKGGNTGDAVGFPLCENQIWKYGESYPNLRNGSYRAWSLLRLVYPAAQATEVKDLITASNKFAVNSIPDYVPFASTAVTAGTGGCAAALTDPGLKVWHSHYQQLDGDDRPLGKAPVNTDTADAGGDMGGAILIYEATLGIPDTTTQLTESTNSNNISPSLRPAK
jgi:hypothetical protein